MVKRPLSGPPEFGNRDWYKAAYEKPPTPPPAKVDGKLLEQRDQVILMLEQQVRERDQMIAVLRDRIADLERQLKER